VINLPNIRQKFTDVKEQVEHKVSHSYLLKYIKSPVIDDDKLLILISIMDRLEMSTTEIENYALPAMLVQIALDTHEQVTNESVEEKERQLTVLAGDYYSGLYYKMLAESEDIMMIKELSLGIKEVNENKISVYQHEIQNVENLMVCIKKIEASLLEKFSEFFKVELWNDCIGNFLLVKRLLQEKQNFLTTGSSFIFEVLKDTHYKNSKLNINGLSGEQQQELLDICDDYIELSKKIVTRGMNQLPYLNDLLEERMIAVITEHQPIAKTLVEEG